MNNKRKNALIIMTFAVAAATVVIKKAGNKKIFLRLYIIAAAVFALVDIVFIEGFDIIAMIMEITLLILMIAFVKKYERGHN